MKQEFIKFVVMNDWTYWSLVRQFIRLSTAEMTRCYEVKRKVIKYIVLGV